MEIPPPLAGTGFRTKVGIISRCGRDVVTLKPLMNMDKHGAAEPQRKESHRSLTCAAHTQALPKMILAGTGVYHSGLLDQRSADTLPCAGDSISGGYWSQL